MGSWPVQDEFSHYATVLGHNKIFFFIQLISDKRPRNEKKNISLKKPIHRQICFYADVYDEMQSETDKSNLLLCSV